MSRECGEQSREHPLSRIEPTWIDEIAIARERPSDARFGGLGNMKGRINKMIGVTLKS
jgi:hypothetical protein